MRIVLFLFLMLAQASLFAQSENLITGKVVDEKGDVLALSTIFVEEVGTGTQTNEKGLFSIGIPSGKFNSITITASYVDKVSETKVILNKDFRKPVIFHLTDQSLTLQNVEVEATRGGKHSVSSIVFDREAIRQTHAFSLADVLAKLPGHTTEAPNLQSPQTLNLRTAANGINAMNNSLGIAIYIDGVRLSKDANMQALSLSIRGMMNSNIVSHTEGGSGYDVTYDGFDLRDIPIENIERIEVIQGVADARFGELTTGAILITTRAGRTPVNVSLNMNGGSTQLTTSKGFQLKGKAGAVNLSAGYTNSNKDPRDKVKSYNRINTSLKWTIGISQRIKNTLSLGFNKRLDDVRLDPDDDSKQMTYQREHSFNISNRTSWSSNTGFLRRADLSVGYSGGKQDSYTQWLLNGMPFGVADKDTTGAYEGFYVPGNYVARQQILGKPVSVNGNLDFSSKAFFTGPVEHRINFGASYSTSGNKGKGTIIDPTKPRWQGANFNFRSERPVDRFKLLPFPVNYGFYVQDNLTGDFLGKRYTVNLGFRGDVQNGFMSYQPRIGTTYRLDDVWSLSFSYGTSTKGPSLAHRYPAPSWTDLPILQLYNGFAAESLFLVYTSKIIEDNSFLKAAKNTSMELGINFKKSWGNGSLYMYAKKNRDGFNSNSTPTPVLVPQYDYTIDDDRHIHYQPNGQYLTYTKMRYTVTNGLYANDYGTEMMFTSKEITALSTSFSVRGALTYSNYDHRNDTTYIAVNQSYVTMGKDALFGVYEPDKNRSLNLVTSFSSMTHIPRLGFTFTLSADFSFIGRTRLDLGRSKLLGYLNRDMQYVAIPHDQVNDIAYDYLKDDTRQEMSEAKKKFVFPAINVTIAKEIRKKIRLMLTGYNLFNIRPELVDPVTKSVNIYNNPVSLSAGINFQL